MPDSAGYLVLDALTRFTHSLIFFEQKCPRVETVTQIEMRNGAVASLFTLYLLLHLNFFPKKICGEHHREEDEGKQDSK